MCNILLTPAALRHMDVTYAHGGAYGIKVEVHHYPGGVAYSFSSMTPGAASASCVEFVDAEGLMFLVHPDDLPHVDGLQIDVVYGTGPIELSCQNMYAS